MRSGSPKSCGLAEATNVVRGPSGVAPSSTSTPEAIQIEKAFPSDVEGQLAAPKFR